MRWLDKIEKLSNYRWKWMAILVIGIAASILLSLTPFVQFLIIWLLSICATFEYLENKGQRFMDDLRARLFSEERMLALKSLNRLFYLCIGIIILGLVLFSTVLPDKSENLVVGEIGMVLGGLGFVAMTVLYRINVTVAPDSEEE